jgi:class 3 adenylate cyclase
VVAPPATAASGADMATSMFTGIECSTGLRGSHPDEMAEALAHHAAMLRGVVEANGVLVVKTTGGGPFAALASAQDAFAAAVVGQQLRPAGLSQQRSGS